MPVAIRVFFISESPASDSIYALNDTEPAVFKVAGTEDIRGSLVAAVGRVAHRGDYQIDLSYDSRSLKMRQRCVAAWLSLHLRLGAPWRI